MEKIVNDSNLTQQCFEQLESDIINTILKPGQKLKVENLKKLLGVGQSPIREALSRLAALGLVEIKLNKGFYVATVSENDIRDVYQTFTEIETLALKKAIILGDDRWAANIIASLYELSLVETNNGTPAKNDKDSSKIWHERNYAFHLALIAGCNSPLLLILRSELYKRFDRYCRMSYEAIKDSLQHNHDEHKALAEAAIKRDVTKAITLMNNHLCGSLELTIELLKKNNLL